MTTTLEGRLQALALVLRVACRSKSNRMRKAMRRWSLSPWRVQGSYRELRQD